MATTYVQISKPELEDWLDSLKKIPGVQKWMLKTGTSGVYQVILSDNVAVEVSSTMKGRGMDEVMGLGRASMQLRLASRITGYTINKKAQGKSHFKRTVNWRKTWAEGVKAFVQVFQKSRGWYDALAAIKDKEKYRKETLLMIEAHIGWETDSMLADFHTKVDKGGILTVNQLKALTDKQPSSSGAGEGDPLPSYRDDVEELLQELRELYKAAKRAGNAWAMKFTEDVARQVKRKGELSPNQHGKIDELFKQFRIKRVAEEYQRQVILASM